MFAEWWIRHQTPITIVDELRAIVEDARAAVQTGAKLFKYLR